MTIEGTRRVIRSNITRAATYLERAKDDPENGHHWLELSYAAAARADTWTLELERLIAAGPTT